MKYSYQREVSQRLEIRDSTLEIRISKLEIQNLSTLVGEDFTFERPWVKKIEYMISYLESLVES
jgi:hypothetical protein